MSVIRIDPATRLEGEAEIKIFLDEKGKVKEAYFQVVEFRGFEKFCIGRPVEELPRIVTRICGVCPWAHHMASAKAVDKIYGREPTITAKKIRELGYCAHILDSHTIHFYVLAAPDFLLPDARRNERNIIGVFKHNPELVKNVLKIRGMVTKIEELIGGKAIHPVTGLPGGVSKKIDETDRKIILEHAKEILKFSLYTVDLLRSIIEKKEVVELIERFDNLKTYYAGLVDRNNRVNFYDGMIRVVDPKGREVFKFDSEEYLDYIAEVSVPWSYTKMPYLKKIGWVGLKDGDNSGVYRVGPLGRLNASDGFSTPKANEYYNWFRDLFGKPAHNTMAYHVARVIEMVYASERLLELAEDEEITSNDIINLEGEFRGRGVGVVEAPRGLLIHHYETDEKAITRKVNLIIPTTMNNPSINIDLTRVATKFLGSSSVDEATINRVEMTYRAYDPCLACSTHMVGNRGVLIKIINSDDKIIAVW